MQLLRHPILSALFAVPALFLCTIILLRPEQVSQRLLRTGGRAIQFMTEEWRIIGVVGTAVVLLTWLVIAIFASREKGG